MVDKQPQVLEGSYRERAMPAMLGKVCLGSDQHPPKKRQKRSKAKSSGVGIKYVFNNFISLR